MKSSRVVLALIKMFASSMSRTRIVCEFEMFLGKRAGTCEILGKQFVTQFLNNCQTHQGCLTQCRDPPISNKTGLSQFVKQN